MQRVSCLDLLRFQWKSGTGEQLEDDGNMLEVWRSGCLIHTDQEIPIGTPVTISAGGSRIDAQVQGNEHDEFGYYVELRTTRPWFPNRYRPAYVLPTAAVRHLRAG
jgi:hypothetical protein